MKYQIIVHMKDGDAIVFDADRVALGNDGFEYWTGEGRVPELNPFYERDVDPEKGIEIRWHGGRLYEAEATDAPVR